MIKNAPPTAEPRQPQHQPSSSLGELVVGMPDIMEHDPPSFKPSQEISALPSTMSTPTKQLPPLKPAPDAPSPPVLVHSRATSQPDLGLGGLGVDASADLPFAPSHGITAAGASLDGAQAAAAVKLQKGILPWTLKAFKNENKAAFHRQTCTHLSADM